MDTPIRGPSHVADRRARLAGRQPCAGDFGFSFDLADAAPVPEWLHIFPLPDEDGKARSRDGRTFIFPQGLAAVVDRTNAELADLGPGPVDLDHRLYDWWGGGGPAAGWMTKVELRDDGIWAQWDPLPEAETKIREKSYRYTSSVMAGRGKWIRDEDGWPIGMEFEVDSIEGFGLTNIPAMRVKSFLSRASAGQETTMKDETIRAVLSKLGLDDTASPDDVRGAFERLAAKPEADAPALADFVPRADFDALKTKLAALEDEKRQVAEAARKAEADALIREALDSGKILPSTRGYYEAQLAREGGLEDFRNFLQAAPSIAAAQKAERRTEVKAPTVAPAGVDPDAYALAAEIDDPHEIARQLQAKRAATAKNAKE